MNKAPKEIFNFWKIQWETCMKSMMAMQEHGESTLEMIRKSGVFAEGSQKMLKDWATQCRTIQDFYFDMVEDHFKKLGDRIDNIGA